MVVGPADLGGADAAFAFAASASAARAASAAPRWVAIWSASVLRAAIESAKGAVGTARGSSGIDLSGQSL